MCPNASSSQTGESRASAPDSTDPPQPLGPRIAGEWQLDPTLAFLNHGGFGARPRAVSEHQSMWRSRFEASPVHCFDRQLEHWLGDARTALGEFVGAKPENLGFVTNTTEGINAILRSLDLQPGGELLTTTHVYNGIRQSLRFAARSNGCSYREVDFPLPVRHPDVIADRVVEALTSETRLLVIDHVSSSTAIVFPIQPIIDSCRQRGVTVLIDGAHAPGMIDVDIEQIGADFYVGNLHKWVCAPSGAGFVWAADSHSERLHPAVISHYLDDGMVAEFDWQGTRDVTPWLCTPFAIDHLEQRYGWQAIRNHNHQLAVWAQAMIAEALDVTPLTPIDGSMIGSMFTVPLPDVFNSHFETHDEIVRALYDGYLVECPVTDWPRQHVIRPSCQVYNTADDYHRLVKAIKDLMRSIA